VVKEGGKDMRYTGFLDTLLIRGHSWRCVRAFTLVELLIILAITGTLAGIALPTYNGYIDKARRATAAVDIRRWMCITRVQASRAYLLPLRSWLLYRSWGPYRA
jgi:Tfp pilus assembly protein FimT